MKWRHKIRPIAKKIRPILIFFARDDAKLMPGEVCQVSCWCSNKWRSYSGKTEGGRIRPPPGGGGLTLPASSNSYGMKSPEGTRQMQFIQITAPPLQAWVTVCYFISCSTLTICLDPPSGGLKPISMGESSVWSSMVRLPAGPVLGRGSRKAA